MTPAEAEHDRSLSARLTSYLPPEQANERGVSLVLSDWASMSAVLSSRISTTSACPAVAASMSGVNPETQMFYIVLKSRLYYKTLFHLVHKHGVTNPNMSHQLR